MNQTAELQSRLIVHLDPWYQTAELQRRLIPHLVPWLPRGIFCCSAVSRTWYDLWNSEAVLSLAFSSGFAIDRFLDSKAQSRLVAKIPKGLSVLHISFACAADAQENYASDEEEDTGAADEEEDYASDEEEDTGAADEEEDAGAQVASILSESQDKLRRLKMLDLDFANCSVQEKGAEKISVVLQELQGLETLRLGFAGYRYAMTAEGVSLLANGIRELTDLKHLHLNLSGSNAETLGISRLREVMSSLPGLVVLSLNLVDSHAGAAEYQALGRAISTLLLVKELCLVVGNLEDMTIISEWASTAKAFTKLETLSLDLSYCGFAQIPALARVAGQGISQLPRITYLAFFAPYRKVVGFDENIPDAVECLCNWEIPPLRELIEILLCWRTPLYRALLQLCVEFIVGSCSTLEFGRAVFDPEAFLSGLIQHNIRQSEIHVLMADAVSLHKAALECLAGIESSAGVF